MDRVYLFMALVASGYALRLILEVCFNKTGLYALIVNFLVKIVYYVLIPLAFTSLFLQRGLLEMDIYVLIYFSVFLSLTYIYTRRLRGNDNATSLFILIGFPNSVFLGFPVVDAILGRVYVAAVFGVITVVLNILIPDLMVKRRFSLRSILTSTGLLGFLIGTIGHYLLGPHASVIHGLINWSNPLLSYVATFTMGMRVPTRIKYTSQLGRDLLTVGSFRFLIAPLMAMLFAMFVGFSRAELVELVIVSSMPPAVMNAIIAERYGWRPQEVALMIALLTIFFLIIVFPTLAITCQYILK